MTSPSPLLGCRFLPPLDPAQAHLSSRYGVRPGRTSGLPTFHAGLDFAADVGALVTAPVSGEVVLISRNDTPKPGMRGYGNAVVLTFGGLYMLFAHLSAVIASEGPLHVGMPIGRVGNTTNGKFPGMGAHLHNELRTRAYPSAYRIYNLDPEPWYAEQGLTFGRRGVFIIDWDKACG